MHEVIIWATFAGAWLLVAGPLYQGSVELGELDFDREGLESIKAASVDSAAGQPSAWWWLLPPVMYVLHRRWSSKYRQATFARLSGTQREQLASFRNKATGWFIVATGATLLAAGETWQVTEHYDWAVWVFWGIFVIMLVASLLNTAVRRISEEQARRSADAAPAVAVEQPSA